MTIIILLVTLLFNNNGLYLLFKFRRQEIRKEIKKKIKSDLQESQLHTFVFSVEEWSKLQWTKHEEEFFDKGCMYDIIKKETKNRLITVKCINDKEEERLFGKLNEIVNKKMNEHSSLALIKILKSIFNSTYVYSVYILDFNTYREELKLKSNYSSLYKSPLKNKLIHPPQIISVFNKIAFLNAIKSS